MIPNSIEVRQHERIPTEIYENADQACIPLAGEICAPTRRAVVWLAEQVGKPVLKLLDEDYSEHGMADLLTGQGPVYGLNIRIFNELQHTIAGWPGGDPSSIAAVCSDLVRQALRIAAHDAWVADYRVWLYRGSEARWDADEIDMAVPLSPRELEQKIQAIFHHCDLAVAYDRYGLANYEAIEAFQRWRP